jgi:hypothetical protein
MDLLRQSSESLAGRIACVEMGPLNVMETAATGRDTGTLWIRGVRISSAPTCSAMFPFLARAFPPRHWSAD